MLTDAIMRTSAPVTQSQLRAGLREIGVRDGGTVMVHVRMRAFGWIVGGADSLVLALLEAVGAGGTLCAQVSCEDLPVELEAWPPAWRDAYERELPPFDVQRSEAGRFEGRFAERLRTWPGARRSANPDTSVAALGARSEWLVEPHALGDGFGRGTPYARLVEAAGDVLLLGAPLETISLLHHAEAIAGIPRKRRVGYRVRLASGWRACEDIDVRGGVYDYARVLGDDEPPLRAIAQAALEAGVGTRATIGGAECHRFPAAALTAFATGWLEERFA
jgi:aminoglycoside 3-N-acetyltransferase